MHTQNPTQTGSRKHRLYIALPLFVALFFVSTFYGSNPLRADITGTNAANIPQHNAQFVASRFLAAAQAGSFTLMGWHGAYDVTTDAQGITVAALTTPVVVTRHDGQWIVPASMQMRIANELSVPADNADNIVTPAPLPAHYLQERLPLALQAFADESVLPVPQSDGTSLFGQSLRLASARQRAIDAHYVQRISELYRAFNGEGDLHELLLSAVTAEALQSSVGRPHIGIFLALALEQGFEASLLQLFMQDTHFQMLSLFHPLLRDQAWILDASASNIQTLLLLPASDIVSDSVSALAIERWGQKLSESFEVSAVNRALPSLEKTITGLRQQGYPERARNYGEQVVKAYAKEAYRLDDNARTSLDAIIGLVSGETPVVEAVLFPEAETASIVETVPVELDAIQMAELTYQARELLAGYGCMFTTHTILTAQPDGRVIVDGIILGTASGDQVLSFTYNAVEDLVENIVKNGQKLPYSLPLQKYVEWVKGK